MKKSKGYLPWYKTLTEKQQLWIFRKWRCTTCDFAKHWCLNDINSDEKQIKRMLKEVRNTILKFNGV